MTAKVRVSVKCSCKDALIRVFRNGELFYEGKSANEAARKIKQELGTNPHYDAQTTALLLQKIARESFRVECCCGDSKEVGEIVVEPVPTLLPKPKKKSRRLKP